LRARDRKICADSRKNLRRFASARKKKLAKRAAKFSKNSEMFGSSSFVILSVDSLFFLPNLEPGAVSKNGRFFYLRALFFRVISRVQFCDFQNVQNTKIKSGQKIFWRKKE